MTQADRLSWTIATYVARRPRGTVFAASNCAQAGIRLAQELFGCQAALCGRGGAYDARGILSLHARYWLYNRHPRAYITLLTVFDTLSRPNALLATPAQVDGAGNANLSAAGNYERPKVAFGGSRGLPDAREIHFVLPSHSPRQLVARVDFVSTNVACRKEPALLFTELCVMRWDADMHQWRLDALLPGADAGSVERKTGFPFYRPETIRAIDEPPAEALEMLQRIDPLNLRALDFISDREQLWDAMATIYSQEMALVKAQGGLQSVIASR